MKLIKSLIESLRHPKYMQLNNETETLISSFEKLCINNPEITDKEIKKILKIKNKVNFKALKHRLENRLINEVFVGSSNENSLETRVYAKPIVLRLNTVAAILLKIGQRDASINLYERCIIYSLKYGFTDIVVSCANALMFHYGIVSTNFKKYEYYSELLKEYSYKLNKEMILTSHYVFVTNNMVKYTGKIPLAISQKIGTLLEEMIIIKNEINTYLSHLYTFDVTYNYFISKGDFRMALEVAIKMKNYLIAINNEEKLIAFTTDKNIGIAHFHLGENSLAYSYFDLCINMVGKSTKYWIYMTSLQFVNLIHSGDYYNALNLTVDVLNNKHLKKFEIFEEMWKIREAYLHFLIRAGKVTLNDEEKERLRPFTISKFLNNVPFYSKDKAGQHINILILQIQFLLLDRKYTQIIDRKEALEKYSQRYIVKNDYYRAQCFINMVLIAIKSSFHPIRTKTLTENLFNKLKKENVALKENEPMIEIIPYDKQWEIILEILEKNK